MTSVIRTRRLGLGALATALAVCLMVAPSAALGKKKGGGTVDITQSVNAPIPDAGPPDPASIGFSAPGTLTSMIDVGKRFQGKRIRDVNVTLQTVGTSGTAPASDIRASLSAPNGTTVFLFTALAGYTGNPSVSIGPLTLDDEARLLLGEGFPTDPFHLFIPWAGTATPLPDFSEPLATMDNGPVRGTWTLIVQDLFPPETSTLISWRLNVLAGRPFKTK